MGSNGKGDRDFLARLGSSLAADVLDPNYPEEEVAAELREAGYDPDEVGRKGAALAQQLLERRRLAWQERARRRRDAAAGILGRVSRFLGLDRKELLARLDAAQHDPGLGDQLALAFRNRKPEDVSDDDLRAILDDIELAKDLEGSAGGDGPPEPK